MKTYDENVISWIMLQLALGQGSARVDSIISHDISPCEIMASNERELGLMRLFTQKEIERILKVNKDEALGIAAECERMGYKIIVPFMQGYPKRLIGIFNPPCALYIKGSLPDIDNSVAVAVVGTRECTKYGEKAATTLCTDLARSGALIVSGGAMGIDSIAHRSAISAGGKTVAVLGCGIDYPYLRVNRELREEISKNGSLVSEYPPSSPVKSFNFPVRNRIISGLSLGTLVIEAGEKSGSLHTASHAVDQNRDVFAVPGNVFEPTFQGTNKLLREGAKPVFTALDILDEYKELYPGKIKIDNINKAFHPVGSMSEEQYTKKSSASCVEVIHRPVQQTFDCNKISEKQVERVIPDNLNDDELKIIHLFSENEMSLDTLADKSEIPPVKLMRILASMELHGIVSLTAGNRYKILI